MDEKGALVILVTNILLSTTTIISGGHSTNFYGWQSIGDSILCISQ